MRWHGAVGVALAVGVESCTLLVSTSGLSGDTPTPLPDASDAPSSATDGPAASDVRGDEEGGTALDCAKPGVVLCDAFERSEASSPLWEDPSASSDGALTIVADPARGSRVLRARLGGSGATGYARLGRDTGKTATSKVECAFKLNALGDRAAGTVGQVNGFSLAKGKDYWNVYVHVTSEGVFLAEQSFPNAGNGAFSQTPIPNLEQGTGWHSVVVTVLVGSPTRLRVAVDGVESFTISSAVGIQASTTIRAGAGITYAAGHPKAEVLVDDYVMTVE